MWRGCIRLLRSAALDQVLLIVESGEVCRKLLSSSAIETAAAIRAALPRRAKTFNARLQPHHQRRHHP